MPRNVTKRHCLYPGCNAWARRGFDTCVSHRDYLLPSLSAEPCSRPALDAVIALGMNSPTRENQIEYLVALRSSLDRCMHGGSIDAATVNYVTLVTRITQTILRSLARDADDDLDATIRDMAEELEALCAPPP